MLHVAGPETLEICCLLYWTGGTMVGFTGNASSTGPGDTTLGCTALSYWTSGLTLAVELDLVKFSGMKGTVPWNISPAPILLCWSPVPERSSTLPGAPCQGIVTLPILVHRGHCARLS